MTRFLVLGGSGFLGSRFMKLLPNCYGTFHGSLNVLSTNMYHLEGSDTYEFEAILKTLEPTVVINCIGFTNVDKCDLLPEKSWQINTWYSQYYAEICKNYKIKFIQISTDHYYNPLELKLRESGTSKPINQYGFSKKLSEQLVLKINPDSIVVRTNFFHFNFKLPVTFLDALILNSKNKKETFSFKDVIFTPISTNRLLGYILNLIELDFCGLINICGGSEISKFDFHQQTLKILGYSQEFHHPTNIDTMRLTAHRPKYMALDNTLLESLIRSKIPNIYDMILEEIRFANTKEMKLGVN